MNTLERKLNIEEISGLAQHFGVDEENIEGIVCKIRDVQHLILRRYADDLLNFDAAKKAYAKIKEITGINISQYQIEKVYDLIFTKLLDENTSAYSKPYHKILGIIQLTEKNPKHNNVQRVYQSLFSKNEFYYLQKFSKITKIPLEFDEREVQKKYSEVIEDLSEISCLKEATGIKPNIEDKLIKETYIRLLKRNIYDAKRLCKFLEKIPELNDGITQEIYNIYINEKYPHFSGMRIIFDLTKNKYSCTPKDAHSMFERLLSYGNFDASIDDMMNFSKVTGYKPSRKQAQILFQNIGNKFTLTDGGNYMPYPEVVYRTFKKAKDIYGKLLMPKEKLLEIIESTIERQIYYVKWDERNIYYMQKLFGITSTLPSEEFVKQLYKESERNHGLKNIIKIMPFEPSYKHEIIIGISDELKPKEKEKNKYYTYF